MINQGWKKSTMPQKKLSFNSALGSALGVAVLGTSLFLTVGVNKSRAGIIESVTENVSGVNTGKGGASCQKIEATSEMKRAGQRAFKHVVDRCGERAELSFKKTEIGKTYWYGWSMFIPSDWKDTDPGHELLNQWATYPTPRNGNFPCGANGSFLSRGRNGKITAGGGSIDFYLQHAGNAKDMECEKYSLAKVSELSGKWVDFVMNAKWTGNSDGFVKLWMKTGDGQYIQKVDYQGRTFWNDEGNGPYFKMGVYKGDPNWKGPAPRTVYTDEYRLGDGNSSFGQVAP